MSLASWFRKRFPRLRKHLVPARPEKGPLREFVYLDEVSLRSLLSSQTGEVTDTRSEQRMDGSQVYVDTAIGLRAPGLSKADIGSRFQTSNSSTLQTSRKATVQSWFRELHGIEGLRLLEPGHTHAAVDEVAQLTNIADKSVIIAAEDLQRGSLVEIKMRLRADPIFHLGTITTEFAAMADDTPEMFQGTGALQQLASFMPINRILQRFLAGLVPIRCEALEHVVIEIQGTEYVVRREVVEKLELKSRPLEVVGVTEHLAYWKDLRRVLFSDAEFTLLGRVARTGIQDIWTPIKLGDLFRVVAPNFDEQIAAASKLAFEGNTNVITLDTNQLAMRHALYSYRDHFLAQTGHALVPETDSRLVDEIERLLPRAESATGQRSAFQVIHDLLSVETGTTPDPEDDSALRAKARDESGLSLFPALSVPTTIVGDQPPHDPARIPAKLLDVEVVAIYW